jgi:hypothetical protein
VEPHGRLSGQFAGEQVRQVFAGDLDVVGGVAGFAHRQLDDRFAVTADEHAPLGQVHPLLANPVEQSHLPGDSECVTADVDRRAVDAEVVAAFDDGDLVAVGGEVQRLRQPGHSGTGDEDVHLEALSL